MKPQRVPTVPLYVLRERYPEVAETVEAEARKRGVPVQEVIADLVRRGWEGLKARPRE